MIVLALDLSTKSSGYAVFDDTKLIDYGCITASSNDLIKRIQKIINGLSDILNKYKIDKVIVEEVRPETGVQNIKTHRALMWLQAAVAFLLHEKCGKVDMEYLYPSQWRKECGIKTGRGIQRTSLKTKDIAFVKDKYGLDVNDDIADAIGIGYAYTNVINNSFDWS